MHAIDVRRSGFGKHSPQPLLLRRLSLPFTLTVPGTMAAATMKRWLTGLLILHTAFANPISSKLPCSSSTPSPPALGVGEFGAVASESDICSRIGIDLLKLGGNAADAMVGTTACIGVVGMYHSGKSSIMYRVADYTWFNTDEKQVLVVSHPAE